MKLTTELALLIITDLKSKSKLTTAQYNELRWAAMEAGCIKYSQRLCAFYRDKTKSYLQSVNWLLTDKVAKERSIDFNTAKILANSYAVNYAYLSLTHVYGESGLLLFAVANIFDNNEGLVLGFFLHEKIFAKLPIRENTAAQHALLATIQTTIFEELVSAWMLYQDIGIERMSDLAKTTEHQLISPLLMEVFKAHAKIFDQHKKSQNERLVTTETEENKSNSSSHDNYLTVVLLQQTDLLVGMISKLIAHNIEVAQKEYARYSPTTDQASIQHQQLKDLLSPIIKGKRHSLLDNNADDFSNYIKYVLGLYVNIIDLRQQRLPLILKEIEGYHQVYGQSILQPALVFLHIDQKQSLDQVKEQISNEFAQQRQRLQKEFTGNLALVEKDKQALAQKKQILTQEEQKAHAAFAAARQDLNTQVSRIKDAIRHHYSPGFYVGVRIGINPNATRGISLDINQVTFMQPK